MRRNSRAAQVSEIYRMLHTKYGSHIVGILAKFCRKLLTDGIAIPSMLEGFLTGIALKFEF